ncbi:hypothetical protein RFI_20223, partial [Reticulomyxa filosa]
EELETESEKRQAVRAKWRARICRGALVLLFVIVLTCGVQVFFVPSLIDHTFKTQVKAAFIFTEVPEHNNDNYNMWVSNTVDHGMTLYFTFVLFFFFFFFKKSRVFFFFFFFLKKKGTPIQFSIQFFNVTNPDKVLMGEYPQLRLTPPVTYYEYYSRRAVNFSEDG